MQMVRFGSDIEDQLVDTYSYKTDRFAVEVKEYLISESNETEFSAEFDYQKVHYQLTGIMEKAELEEILKNLHFFNKNPVQVFVFILCLTI